MKVNVRWMLTGAGVAMLAVGLWAYDPWAALSAVGACLYLLGGFS